MPAPSSSSTAAMPCTGSPRRTSHGVPGSFNALLWEALGILESRGIDTFDLLGSGPLAGVVAFKESIGGVPHRVRAVVGSHPLVAAARTARRLLPRPPRSPGER